MLQAWITGLLDFLGALMTQFNFAVPGWINFGEDLHFDLGNIGMLTPFWKKYRNVP